MRITSTVHDVTGILLLTNSKSSTGRPDKRPRRCNVGSHALTLSAGSAAEKSPLDRNADCDAVARLTSCRIRTDAHLHVPVSLSFPKAPFTSHDLDCINVKDVFYVFYSRRDFYVFNV